MNKLPRFKNRIDTGLDRYKTGYSARHSRTGYQAHSEWPSAFSERLEDAVMDLRTAQKQCPGLMHDIYEINLTGDDRIHWMRLMDVSEYAHLIEEY